MSLLTDSDISNVGLILSVGGALSQSVGAYSSATTLQNNLEYRAGIATLNAGIDTLNASRSRLNARGMLTNAKASDLNSYFASQQANLAEMGRQQAIAKGQTEQAQLTLQAGNVESSQRAEMAANGIDIGEGSAAEVQASTRLLTETDKNQIAANALKEAFGYTQQIMDFQHQATNDSLQAGNYRLEANNQRLDALSHDMAAASDLGSAAMDKASAKAVKPGMDAFSSLLGSAGNVLGNWYQYKAMRQRGY